jgi:hypothetical protein
MKTKILLLLLLTTCVCSYSQETSSISFKKNETKGNALFLVLGAVEVTYERLLNEDSGLGVSVFFINEEDFDTNFSFTPFYRAYFGKKAAAGFFVEGFSMINSGVSSTDYIYDSNGNLVSKNNDHYIDCALGFGLGSKWVHKKGFVFEINAGIGRNLFSDDAPEVVGRGGITLGYRF